MYKVSVGIVIILMITTPFINVHAQLIMLAGDADYIDDVSELSKFYIDTCSDDFAGYQGGLIHSDYTYHQDGFLYGYGIGWDFSTPPGGPPILDLSSTRLVKCGNGPNFQSSYTVVFFNQDTTIEAIATGLDSIIYAAGKSLWRYAPNTDETNFLGNFPPEWQAEGGMTLREGELYMTTVNNDLIRINTQNPAESEWLHTFNDSINRIEALVTIPFTCDSIITYAFAPLGGFEDSTMIYEVDFNTYNLTPICKHHRSIIAAAAIDELTIPPCELYADLDFDDNTSTGFDFIAAASCTNPISITDIDIEVFGQIEIDSFVLEISGISDAGMEYLSGIDNGNVQIQQNNNGGITLINTGNASFADFEAVFSSIQYFNDAVMPTYGARTISVTPYALYYQGAPSFAYINLISENLSIDVVTAVACFNETNGSASLSGSGGYISLHLFMGRWNTRQHA